MAVDAHPLRRITAYCARCKRVVTVTRIRGHNGTRDRKRCDTCGRTWPA